MKLEDVIAALTLAMLVAYGVLAGADFGGGVLTLAARGPRRDAQRDAIDEAMGPVWEANHVWLIFVIVLLFSCFPRAFTALTVALFTPFHLVLVGITLRGAAFVFRHYGPHREDTLARWSTVFGAASVITPFLLGQCLGAVSSGRIRVGADGAVTAPAASWLSPLPLAIGALFLAMCAYLAAVFLTVETDGDLREDFRRRALASGTVVVGLSGLAIPLLAREAPHLFHGLLSTRATPVFACGVVAALASGAALWGRRYRLARATSIAQVALVLGGWGLAQYPYILYPDLSVTHAAAPDGTLRFVLWTVPFGMALLVPSLWLLFRVFKGRRAA